MTPNDLDEYLLVLTRNQVGAAVVKLPGGAEFSITFIPQLPTMPKGDDPTPGGWKSPQHLDNPADLRADLEYRGELP